MTNEQVVVSILEHTTQHGAIEGKTQTKPVKYYNLDTIIAVGYLVKNLGNGHSERIYHQGLCHV